MIGDPEKPTWSLRGTQDAELAAAFPDLDRKAEYAKAKGWLAANRSKRKTARGMMSFLFRWLERAQNNAARPVKQAPESFAERDARLKREAAQRRGKEAGEAYRVEQELAAAIRKAAE